MISSKSACDNRHTIGRPAVAAKGVKCEAAPREGRKGGAVTPVQGEGVARLAGRRIGKAGPLDHVGPCLAGNQAIESPMTPPPQIRLRMTVLVRRFAQPASGVAAGHLQAGERWRGGRSCMACDQACWG